MSSANFFNGYATEGKPSSRVLNPPGGRSNNIFGGTYEEPKAAGKPTANAQQENQQAPTETQSTVTTSTKAKDNIFGADTTNQPKQNKGRRGFNPITGQAYEDDEPEKTRPVVAPAPVEQQPPVNTTPNPVGLPTGATLHTSSRVLQPPGGKSTKLW